MLFMRQFSFFFAALRAECVKQLCDSDHAFVKTQNVSSQNNSLTVSTHLYHNWRSLVHGIVAFLLSGRQMTGKLSNS